MRREGVEDGYERMKAATRGQSAMDLTSLHAVLDSVPISDEAKATLRALGPDTYLPVIPSDSF